MATPRKPKSQWKKDGRPTVMTPDVLQKLEDAFTTAFTDEMACLYAGIAPKTLYDYCQSHPKFAQRKEQLKHTPSLKAQRTLVKDLDTVGGSRWWAEHTMPHLVPKTKVEHSGIVETKDVTQTEAIKDVVTRYENELRDAIAKKPKPLDDYTR